MQTSKRTNIPSNLVCIDDFEKHAYIHLDRNALDYYRSGANDELSLKENRRAFSRLRFRPRFLHDVSERNMETTILGNKISFPVCVSPTAMQRMAHPDGEVATARAAESLGTAMTLSTLATSSIEEVAEGAPSLLRWFQLYIYHDREITKQLVRRAENANFKAIVLTIDSPKFGLRLADARNKFSLPSHLRLSNFQALDVKSVGVQKAQKESGLNEYAASLFDPSITWQDVSWLSKFTTLPVVVKGVLTAEDAVLSIKHGAAAVMVSNHGARQLDGVPATIDVLPEVVKAVDGRCEVYIDGGIRTGTDVLKALALGARAAFIGRPLLWGLAYKGEEGARLILEIMKKELDLAMALSGCACIADIKPSLVVKDSFYSRL